MHEKKLKHLEFIQNTITRMAGNLFYLRGWVITLIVGMLALFSQIEDSSLIIVFLIFVIVIFWMYDGYFLSLERMYRDLYDKIRLKDEEKIDFSMNISEYKKLKKNSIVYCIFSKTLLFFYIPLLIISLYIIFNTK